MSTTRGGAMDVIGWWEALVYLFWFFFVVMLFIV
jgi:hypothetical protein